MKTIFWIIIGAFALAAPLLSATPAKKGANLPVQATVVRVQKNEVGSVGDGLTSPTDAPLSSRYYAYDVSVRVDCHTYVGRYQTEFDYLPSAFASGQPIQVRMTKHAMYFELADKPEMKMAIVHRSAQSGIDCGADR